MSTPHPASREVIAVDMDEVIADALSEHLRRYNLDFPPAPDDPHFPHPLTAAQLHGRRLWQAVPASRHAALDAYFRDEDFFRNLPVMADAQRVLARLQTRYEIFIASAAMEVPSSFTAKFLWLADHFPFIPSSHIVFCGDKSILRANYLIDDNPRQLDLFEAYAAQDSSSPNGPTAQADASENRRQGVLFTAPANMHLTTGFCRVRSWLEVESLFLK